MNKIAVFYHCRISNAPQFEPGTDQHLHIIHPNLSCAIISSQMEALRNCGLENQADEIHIGINGNEDEYRMVKLMAPNKANVVCFGPNSTTEIPTMNLLRHWLTGRDEWFVMYHHTKGVSQPLHPGYQQWRMRMQYFVVQNWRQCVTDLSAGCEAVGCHWLTPEQYGGAVASPFFGGTFWWARSSYLKRLPPLPEARFSNRYEAESWIGKGNPRPRVRDYCPGWPPV